MIKRYINSNYIIIILDQFRELYSDIISTNIIDDSACFRHLCTEDIVLKTSKRTRHLYDERKNILYKE